jgi:hypothetical protein
VILQGISVIAMIALCLAVADADRMLLQGEYCQ